MRPHGGSEYCYHLSQFLMPSRGQIPGSRKMQLLCRAGTVYSCFLSSLRLDLHESIAAVPQLSKQRGSLAHALLHTRSTFEQDRPGLIESNSFHQEEGAPAHPCAGFPRAWCVTVSSSYGGLLLFLSGEARLHPETRGLLPSQGDLQL